MPGYPLLPSAGQLGLHSGLVGGRRDAQGVVDVLGFVAGLMSQSGVFGEARVDTEASIAAGARFPRLLASGLDDHSLS